MGLVRVYPVNDFTSAIAGTALQVDDVDTVGIQVSTPASVSAVNEVQVLTPSGAITGGTWTITYAGQTTAALQWNANAATISTALDNLSNLGVGDLVATGGPISSGAVTLTAAAALAATPIAQVTVTTTSLTGTTAEITPSTTTAGVAAVNEIQLVTPAGLITGGTWTITYDGQTTSALAHNANAATITAALVALSNVASGDMVATGGPISSAPVTITVAGALAATNVAEVTVDASSLTTTTVTLTPSTVTAGVAAVNEVQTLTPGGVVTGGTYTITFDGFTSSAIAFDANAATITTALDAMSNLAPGDCVATGGPVNIGNVTLTFGGARAGTNVPQVTIQSSLTGVDPTLTPSTTTAGVAAVNEVQRLTMAGVPFGGTFTITYSGQTTSALAYNASNATIQAALTALSNIGVDECVVSAGPLAAATPINLTFVGALAATNVDQITADASSLTYVPTLTPSTTTAGAAPVPEVQRLTTTGTPTGGTFTLTYGGYTTAALPYNATAAQVQAALLDLRSIPVSGVACAGGPINAAFVSVTWADPIANVAQMTVNDDALTSTTIAVTPSTTAQGVAAVSYAWVGTITFQASIDGVNYVSIAGQDTVGTDLTAGVVSTTTDKMFRFDVRGYTMFRPNCTAYTSGTIRTQCTGSRDR